VPSEGGAADAPEAGGAVNPKRALEVFECCICRDLIVAAHSVVPCGSVTLTISLPFYREAAAVI
jgi:hypothetical protein